jgi:hypothetical protein
LGKIKYLVLVFYSQQGGKVLEKIEWKFYQRLVCKQNCKVQATHNKVVKFWKKNKMEIVSKISMQTDLQISKL